MTAATTGQFGLDLQSFRLLAVTTIFALFAAAELIIGRFFAPEATSEDDRLDVAVNVTFPIISGSGRKVSSSHTHGALTRTEVPWRDCSDLPSYSEVLNTVEGSEVNRSASGVVVVQVDSDAVGWRAIRIVRHVTGAMIRPPAEMGRVPLRDLSPARRSSRRLVSDGRLG